MQFLRLLQRCVEEKFPGQTAAAVKNTGTLSDPELQKPPPSETPWPASLYFLWQSFAPWVIHAGESTRKEVAVGQ